MIMLTIVEDFYNFIEEELKKRDWTWYELGRRARLSDGTISNIRTGARGVGKKTLNGIARALSIPTEQVYRLAGLLPPVPESTEQTEQLLHSFNQLNETDKQTVLDMIEFLLSK